MLFNNPNFQQVNQSTESNPRPSVQDIVEKYSFRQSDKKNDDRVTFGQTYKMQRKTENEKSEQLVINEQNLSKVLSDFSIISDDPSVFIGVSNLKDKVLNLIQTNRDSVNQNEKKLQEEVSQIALEYSMYSQIGKSKNEPELQQMCALVEDFLYQFQKSKSLEISIIQNISSDDSFYMMNENVVEKLNQKLNSLKEKLNYQLTILKLPETKIILQQTIDNLNEIISANDISTIKTVIFKIEQKITQIKTNEYALLELYDYINKALKVSRAKLTDTDRLKISKIYQALEFKGYPNAYQQALAFYEIYRELPTKPSIDYPEPIIKIKIPSYRKKKIKERGKYRSYSLNLKINALKWIQEGKNERTIAEQLDIPLKNIKRWKKQGPYRKKGCGRKSLDLEMEQKLAAWCHETMQKTKQRVSRAEIQAQALKFIKKDVEFKASKGWTDKFVRKYNLIRNQRKS